MSMITLNHHLPFVTVTLRVGGQSVSLSDVLLDTGSAATFFRADDLIALGLVGEPSDVIHEMFGVGGSEFVIEKSIESLAVGDLSAAPFRVQMGALNYGINMRGILGTDFLVQASAVIDFNSMTVRKG